MKKILKPWGYELLIEKNEHYVVKELSMNKGHMCSLQYHEKKKETIYMLNGTLKVHIGDTINNLSEIILNPHETLTIEPVKLHRMEAIEDSVYLEASTPELDDVI